MAYLSLPGKVLVEVLRVQIQDHVGHVEPEKLLFLGVITDFSPLFPIFARTLRHSPIFPSLSHLHSRLVQFLFLRGGEAGAETGVLLRDLAG